MRIHLRLRFIAAATTIMLIIAFAIGGIAPAMAQTQTPTPVPTEPATDQTEGVGPFARAGVEFARALIDATVQTVGINEGEVLKALADGKSIKEIVAENNADLEEVKILAKQTLTDAINKSSVAANVKTRLLANLDSLIERGVNGTLKLNGKAGTKNADTQLQRVLMRTGGVTLLIQETSKATSISQRELLKMLRNDKTLAQIAIENKAEVSAIVNAAIVQTTTRLDRLVKANRISQAQADQLLALLPATYTKLMNEVNPLRAGGAADRQGGNSRGAPQSPTPDAPATPSL